MGKIKIQRSVLYLISLFLILLAPRPAFSQEDPGQLFQEAVHLFTTAQQAEKESYPKAYALYAEAASKLDRIYIQHPNSSIAKKLFSGEGRLGGHTIKAFKEDFLLFAKRKAEMEEDPLELLLFIADKKADYGSPDLFIEFILDELVTSNQIIRALEIATDMQGRKKPLRLIKIAHEYNKTGEKEMARSIAEKALESNDYAWQITAVADFFREIGETGKMKLLLEQALKLARSNQNPHELAPTALSYSKAGERDKALSIINEAIQLAKIKDYWLIIIDISGAGFYDEALRLAKEIDDRTSRISSLSLIAVDLANNGRKEEAETILSEAMRKGVTWKVLENFENMIKQMGLTLGLIESPLSNDSPDWSRRSSFQNRDIYWEAFTYTKAGFYDQAVDLALTYDGHFFSVVMELERAGENEKAIQLIKEADQIFLEDIKKEKSSR